TIFTKLQSDVRYAEGEIMHNLFNGCEHDEEPYFEKSTPEIKVAIENKNISDIPKEQSNFATLAADLMNVLYAGFDNPVSISVSGVPLSSVSVSMSGGSLTAKGNGHYIVRPAAVGTPVTFDVSISGRKVGSFDFKVRKLPDPTPYIPTGDDRFWGGGMAKAGLMGASGIKAAIDDGLLDIEFMVNSFEAVFFDNLGNAVPLASNGANFSERQKTMIRQLARNKRFYITHVSATGPDGLTRTLKASMEVIVK
ncbi:MAG: gliding motility protein GldM, partial [Bacteroidaceae bacterium]|nr:gliding motility protein GldM [Bacteroidaceae bacterium]